MQLYKSRDFSEFFSDTFTFIKENGKHFFKHYFIINGALLLILAALGYVFSSYFLQDIFNSAYGLETSNRFETLITENTVLFAILILAFVFIGILFGAVSYIYTPIYFKLYEKNNNTNFETKDIINAFKTHLGKLILFIILSFFFGLVLLIPFGIVSVIVSITIVGMLLLPLIVGLYMGLFNATLLEYLEDKRGYFDSFGYAWTIITSKFWPAIGCMGIFYLMAYIIQISFSIIQSIFNLGTSLTIPINGNLDIGDTQASTAIVIVTIILYVVSFVVSFLVNAVLQINQSIVYYSVKEENDNINLKSDIDLIGTSEE